MLCLSPYLLICSRTTQAFERAAAEAGNSQFEEKGAAILSSGGSIEVDAKAVSASELKGAEAEFGNA